MTERPARPYIESLRTPRRIRIEEVARHRTRRLVVVLENIDNPQNVAAVLRTCEGFGLQEIHVVSTRLPAARPRGPEKENARITKGAEKWLDLFRYEETDACFAALKARGFQLCASDLKPGARSLLELESDQPLALVFGNESDGLSEEALRGADCRFQIPMLGFSQSLNISVAVAVTVSHLVFRRLASRGAAGELDEAQERNLVDRFSTLAIQQRHRIFRDPPGGSLNPTPQVPSSPASRSSQEKP